jgi:hypothetical protein
MKLFSSSIKYLTTHLQRVLFYVFNVTLHLSIHGNKKHTLITIINRSLKDTICSLIIFHTNYKISHVTRFKYNVFEPNV